LFRFFGLFPSANPGKTYRKVIEDPGAFQGFPYPIPVRQEKAGCYDKEDRPEQEPQGSCGDPRLSGRIFICLAGGSSGVFTVVFSSSHKLIIRRKGPVRNTAHGLKIDPEPGANFKRESAVRA
jgi:hypothetical protein